MTGLAQYTSLYNTTAIQARAANAERQGVLRGLDR